MEQKAKEVRKVKSKTKFIWLYTIILFSIALILILVAGLTQQNYEEELQSHTEAAVGMQRSVTELSNRNMALQQENEALKAENEALKATQTALEEDAKVAGINSTLVEAYHKYRNGYTSAAKELVKAIDSEALSDEQKTIYTQINK